MIMDPANASRHTGYRPMLIRSPSKPNNGGMNVLPIYAQAICIPIMDWEYSVPKLSGVS